MDRRTAHGLIDRLRSDADRICARFGLRYAAIEAERANVKRRYGICYADGSIRIRLRHASTGEALKYSSLVSTLCHELAHLRHFDHSPGFHDFYHELLRWSRREGIYQPRSRADRFQLTPRADTSRHTSHHDSNHSEPSKRAPEQLTLF